MKSRSWLGLGAALAITSCAHSTSAGSPATGSPADLVPSTLALVEEVRGLHARTPIAVQILAPKEFSKILGDHNQSSHEDLERLRASWIAFGLMPPALDLESSLRNVFDEQVVGFYDPKSKALYVRSQMPAFGGIDMTLLTRGVLAHEIEHALQDQLLISLDATPKDEEANLARTALIEGDAQLTMIAALAKLNGQSIQGALGNVAALTRLGPDIFARISGFSPKLLEAPLVLRETLAFPYVAGLSFAGALWEAGGFDFVDRAFRAPPVSASQVLHPARYSKDLRPRPVAEPSLPAGWAVKDRGSLGELGTLAVLEQCLARVKAEGNAAALAGDRYVVGQRPDGRLGLIWVSLWPTRKSADAFALNMIWQEPCWDKLRGDGKGSVGSEVQIQIAASDTALAPRWIEMVVLRGVPEPDAKPILAALQSSEPGPAPTPKPPFGNGFTLKPVAPIVPEVRHGTLSGSAWRDEGLGLAATIPTGWIPKINLAAVALVIAAPSGSRDNGVYGYVPAPLNETLLHQAVGALTGSVEASVGGGQKLRQESEGRVEQRGVTGLQSRWVLEGGDLHLRILMLPICAGRATAMLATFAHGSSAAALDGWADSFTIGKPGAACPAQGATQ